MSMSSTHTAVNWIMLGRQSSNRRSLATDKRKAAHELAFISGLSVRAAGHALAGERLDRRLGGRQHRSHGRHPDHTGFLHHFAQCRVFRKLAGIFRVVPFQKNGDGVGIIHVAVNLLDTRAPAARRLGFVGVESRTPCCIIGDGMADIEVNDEIVSL